MLLAIALTPFVWLIVVALAILGGIALRSAGARGWWVLAGIAALLMFTNPSSESHREALRHEVRSALRQGSTTRPGAPGGSPSRPSSTSAATPSSTGCSTSITTMDGNVVSVGVLGQVLVGLDLSPQGKRRPSQ